MDYKKLCEQVQSIARQTGSYIKAERLKLKISDIEIKSASSLVTYVDKTAEKMIVTGLRELIPDSGFVTEEGTASFANEKLVWVIDPLDGTTNYIHGLSPYSVSIGLMDNRELVLGVVYEVEGNEMFYAWKGSPAYSNDMEIRVSPASSMEDTFVAIGFPYYDFALTEKYMGALKELMIKTRGIRRFGSAAVDLCYVASGRFNAFYEHALHAWDVAAGGFILQQAGGKITDFNGGDNWLFGGELIAASSPFFPGFYEIINRYFGIQN